MTHPLPYSHDITPALDSTIGQNGVSTAALEQELAKISAIASSLKTRSEKGELSFLSEPQKTADLAKISELAEKLRDGFAHVVVMGTGGSSLGGLTLSSLVQPRFIPAGTNLHFVDNTDPQTLEQLFDQLPLSDTAFIFVSKSGNTVETLAQAILAVKELQAQSLSVAEHCLAITMPRDRGLRRLAEKFEIETLEHDGELGGRFSVLSWVGLIPAAIAGLNPRRLREGAQAVMAGCFSANVQESPAAIGAALQYLMIEQGKNQSVVMPYCDRLQNFGRWYQQLWAESVGKDGKGSTAIGALGAVDQHSQLQLYAEGPKDKLVTFITLDNAGKGHAIDGELAKLTGLDYLSKHRIGDVINAQQAATMQSLTGYGTALRHMRLQDDTDYTIGALLQHFMMETAFTAGLLQVDAFNQPGVEESKNLTRDTLQAA